MEGLDIPTVIGRHPEGNLYFQFGKKPLKPSFISFQEVRTGLWAECSQEQGNSHQCLPSPEDVKMALEEYKLSRLKDWVYRLKVEHLLKISTSLSLPFL